MEVIDFLHAGTNSCKIKVLQNFEVGMVTNGCCQSGDGTLQLTVNKDWTDGITDFFHVDTDSQKLKADQNFFGWA